MSAEFNERHVVITGGTGALGCAVTKTFLDAGATVHIPCFETEAPEGGQDVEHERCALTYGVDLLHEPSVAGFYAALPGLWASIHLAGGFAMSPIMDISKDDFEKMIALNATTCFLSSREAIGVMRARGNGGRIVNVATRVAIEPVGGMTAYVASKAAVAAMTQALAKELSAEGILVNAVLPSIIDTPANRAAMPDAAHETWPTPAQLATAIHYLASPANELTSGALLPVYGNS